MAKRVLMVVIAATAISIPAVAGAAGSKQKHKGKAHPIWGRSTSPTSTRRAPSTSPAHRRLPGRLTGR